MTTANARTNGNQNGKTKDPVIVVVQLSGGNDFMNTVIPFTEGIYYDNRPLVGIPASLGHSLQANLRTGKNGNRPGSRDRTRQPVALPGNGHLAHVRTRNHRH